MRDYPTPGFLQAATHQTHHPILGIPKSGIYHRNIRKFSYCEP
jgi:hypothetical protein